MAQALRNRIPRDFPDVARAQLDSAVVTELVARRCAAADKPNRPIMSVNSLPHAHSALHGDDYFLGLDRWVKAAFAGGNRRLLSSCLHGGCFRDLYWRDPRALGSKNETGYKSCGYSDLSRGWAAAAVAEVIFRTKGITPGIYCDHCLEALSLAACRSGNRPLLTIIGRPVRRDQVIHACWGQHDELALDLFRSRDSPLSCVGSHPARLGLYRGTTRCLEWGGVSCDRCSVVRDAAAHGCMNTVCALLKPAHDQLDVNTALHYAGRGGQHALARLLIDRYHANPDAEFLGACAGGQRELALTLRAEGSQDGLLFLEGFLVAAANDHVDLAAEVADGTSVWMLEAALGNPGRGVPVLDRLAELGIANHGRDQSALDAMLCALSVHVQYSNSSSVVRAAARLIAAGADPALWNWALPVALQRFLISRCACPPRAVALSLRGFSRAMRLDLAVGLRDTTHLPDAVITHVILPFFWDNLL